MLRIYFTSEDLGRVRLATRMDPLWEIIGSLHILQTRESPVVFEDWFRQARPRLRHASTGSAARVLAALAPRDVYFPDFLTPAEPPRDLECGVDAILSTPHRRVRAELERLAQRRRLPAWVGQLAAGERGALRSLGEALNTYYQDAVAPHASHMETTLAAERAQCARAMLDGGTEGLLSSLGPTMRWRSPVLEVSYPVDYTMKLAGRGLLLVPSYFTWRQPVTLADRDLQPVLVYPVEHRLPLSEARAGLGALLGPTRAAVLETIGVGATTTAVARQVGIAPATASHHATVLREAGLVTTIRDANRVIHTPTPLGEDLLNQADHRGRNARTKTRVRRRSEVAGL